MRKPLIFSGFLVVGGILIYLLSEPRVVVIVPSDSAIPTSTSAGLPPLAIPEAVMPETASPLQRRGGDIPPQAPLPRPPATVKAIYLTGWSAGSEKKVKSVIDLIDQTELNAVVIDIKDYSGYLSYATGIPEAVRNGAESEIRISAPNSVIKRFHDRNIYVIGRITVFQDPVLAAGRPEWAYQDKETGKLWEDNRGLAWLDPAGRGTWDYAVAVAKDALARGFDEINFDYIRFASDGELERVRYPYWLGKTERHEVIKEFFAYVRRELGEAKLSADLFGLAAIVDTDLGIGQIMEDAFPYFDYIAPMTYPSHYGSGFLGYKNPAQYPYEVVKDSMEHALRRLITYNQRNATGTEPLAGPRAKIRPWLQDFDLGADYDAKMVRKQIDATEEVFLKNTTTAEMAYAGWFLWDPANVYTKGALKPE